MPKIKPELLTDYEKKLPHHELILVEGGSFEMGGPDEEARDNEKPVHKVSVSSFYMGKFPVTQALYEKVMGKNPSNFKGLDDRPVEMVSWEDAKAFIKKLNGETKKKYRLPTEAEWEFAARGGNYSEDYIYVGSDKLSEVAWYRENSDDRTHPVGKKMGNELGLYDMSGNVWEWCEDDYHENYKGAPNDGSAWFPLNDRGRTRVVRGGSYFSDAHWCRVASRSNYSLGSRNGSIGFRLVLPVQ